MSKTLIIIDDSEEDRYLARRTISSCGYDGDILEFADGADFLELLGNEREFSNFRNENLEPYLVLLDINMPRVDGFSVAAELSAWQERNNERCWFVVMMLTSSSNPADMEKAKEYSLIREFATKPLGVNQLKEVIDDAIGETAEAPSY